MNATKFKTSILLLMLVGCAAFAIYWGVGSLNDGAGGGLFEGQAQANSAIVTGAVSKREDAGYVTSDACVSCHPEQHSTWHDSYHRTMTQVASPETVVASFDGVDLKTGDQTARLSRRGDKFFVNSVDQAWERDKFAEWAQSRSGGGKDPFDDPNLKPPRKDAEVVMTTGSHHFQAYWVKGKDDCELFQFPWRYHIAEKRWVHRKDVFLTPPEWRPGMWFRVWNSQCIYCHSTGPSPGQDPETGLMANTRIGELGISCEACHGPAEDHISFHNDKANGVSAAGDNAAVVEDPIINPAKLKHEQSSQVCGSCHSHFIHKDPNLAIDGPRFRPGENLFKFGVLEKPPAVEPVMSRFWGDGVNRSGGREFSGMSSSECYEQGEISCISCHNLHGNEPNDQLSDIGRNSEACLQCHEQFRSEEALTAHTHHLANSSGSDCYNCHMPHTNYALYKAIRSHTINTPTVTSLRSNSRPNACNLCHLDQTLQWTADHLQKWYSMKPPQLSFDDKYISAGVLWSLKGDAGQRVITAWHFGWDAAREASTSEWMLPTIAELMKDPYAAVRWVAFDALRKDKRFADAEYDFDGAESDRIAVADRLVSEWAASREAATESDPRWSRVLFDKQGVPDRKQVEMLLKDRDQRFVAGVE